MPAKPNTRIVIAIVDSRATINQALTGKLLAVDLQTPSETIKHAARNASARSVTSIVLQNDFSPLSLGIAPLCLL
jgi:hypothetical protein